MSKMLSMLFGSLPIRTRRTQQPVYDFDEGETQVIKTYDQLCHESRLWDEETVELPCVIVDDGTQEIPAVILREVNSTYVV